MTADLFPEREIRNQALTRADLESLTGAFILVDCDLEEADLSGLAMMDWRFERCQIRRTRFSSAQLRRAQFLSCRGAFADFTGADLEECRMTGSDFNNSLFRRANLNAMHVEGCKLTGADLCEARAMDIRLAETLLINARLPSWSFRKMTLERIDFSQADLRKSDFRAVTFHQCSLRDANLVGCRFEGADLRGADLGGLRLLDAIPFRGATISREQAGQLLGELGLSVR